MLLRWSLNRKSRSIRALLAWAVPSGLLLATVFAQPKQRPSVPKGSIMTTRATIEGYFDNLKQKKNWQSFLADDMVFTSFTSPEKRVTGKAAYLQSTKNFYGGIVAFEVRDLLIDGDKACALTRYRLQRPQAPMFNSDVAEIFRVRDGKITSFDIYFDSAPFPK